MNREVPTYQVAFYPLNGDTEGHSLSAGSPYMLIPLAQDRRPLIRRLDIFDDEAEYTDTFQDVKNPDTAFVLTDEKGEKDKLQPDSLPPLRILSRNSIFETQRRFGAFDDIQKIPNYIECVNSINFVWKQRQGAVEANSPLP